MGIGLSDSTTQEIKIYDPNIIFRGNKTRAEYFCKHLCEHIRRTPMSEWKRLDTQKFDLRIGEYGVGLRFERISGEIKATQVILVDGSNRYGFTTPEAEEIAALVFSMIEDLNRDLDKETTEVARGLSKNPEKYLEYAAESSDPNVKKIRVGNIEVILERKRGQEIFGAIPEEYVGYVHSAFPEPKLERDYTKDISDPEELWNFLANQSVGSN